jgi:hypothetical protein
VSAWDAGMLTLTASGLSSFGRLVHRALRAGWSRLTGFRVAMVHHWYGIEPLAGMRWV